MKLTESKLRAILKFDDKSMLGVSLKAGDDKR